MQVKFPHWLPVALVLFASLSLDAREVNREKPPVYLDRLSGYLVPTEEILERGERYRDDESGVILIDEVIHYVDGDGKYYRLYRDVSRAHTQAGAQTLEKDKFSFRKSGQKVTLITARTIQPDGTVIPVRDNAALVQDIRQTGNSLYEDQAEIIVIFPDVKAGSVTERVILIESEEGFRIRDEYMATVTWDNNVWPREQKRFILDLPTGLAERIQFSNLGSPIPAIAREEDEKSGHVVFRWEEGSLPRSDWEANTPPYRQVGPTTSITTWESWDDLATWYGGLLEDRTRLSPELKSMLETETKGLSDRDGIIEALYHQVANEVRYVGLEFGMSALQPYSCEEVWENQYGDCKDKSNLIATLLREKGIEAYLALVDTDHFGKVNRASPSYLPFNHAIVALRDPGESSGWKFLDPTIRLATPGTLGQWSANRDALILADGEAIWSRTPDTTAGELDYFFTLDLDPSGTLSGWMNVTARGYYAAYYADKYLGLGQDSKIRETQDLVQRFYPNAIVIDLEHDEIDDFNEQFKFKAYLDIPYPYPDSGEDPARFAFPEQNRVIPGLGEKRERKKPWFLWKDDIKVGLDIGMPEGWNPGRAPQPLTIDSEAIRALGSWKRKENRFQGSFFISLPQSTILPSSFASAFNAIQSISTWLKRPAEFVAGEGFQSDSDEQNSQLSDFKMPMMPTSTGQLNLVNARYPISRGIALRRTALKRLIQYFPNDVDTTFQARTSLSYLDYLEDENKQAISDLDDLIANWGSDVDPSSLALAKYILGLSLMELEETRERGITEMRALASNEELSDYRRSWSAFQAANGMFQNGRASEATDLLGGFLDFDEPEYSQTAHSLMVAMLADQNQPAEISKLLEGINDPEKDIHLYIVNRLAADALEEETEIYNGDDSSPATLESLMLAIDWGPMRELSSEVDKAIQRLESRSQTRSILSDVHAQLKTLLSREDLPDWTRRDDITGDLETPAEFEAKLRELNEEDSLDFISTAITYFTRFPVQEDLPFFLWRLMAFAEWSERPSQLEAQTQEYSLFEKLAEVAAGLPKSNEYYWEALFVRSTWHRSQLRFDEEAELYLSMLDDPEFQEDFLVSASFRCGMALEKSGRFEEAEQAYLRARDRADGVAQAIDGLLRAFLIRLELGRQDEALDLLMFLRDVDPDTLASSRYEITTRLFLKLAEDPERAKAYWKHTAQWWPKWVDLCRTTIPGNEDFEDGPLVGMIDDLDQYQRDLGQGSEDRDGPLFMRAFRIPAHVARWSPDLLEEFSRVILVGGLPCHPGTESEWRSLVIEAFDGIAPFDPNEMGGFLMYYMVALADDYPEKAILKGREYFSDYNEENRVDGYSEAVARIMGICALEINSEPEMLHAANLIGEQLSSDGQFSSRNLSINGLANLYRRLGDYENEEKLLRRELNHPVVKGDISLSRSLKDRLSHLNETTRTRALISEEIGNWIERRELNWLDSCPPQDLRDRRLRDIFTFLSEGSEAFNDFETIKANLLVAREAPIGSQEAWDAFDEAVSILIHYARDYQEILDIYDSVVAMDRLPSSMRVGYSYVASIYAAERGDTDNYQRFRDHPIMSDFWQPNDNRKKLLDLFCASPPSQLADRVKFVHEMAEDGVDSYELSFFRDVFDRLLRHNAWDEADEIREAISDWKLDDSVEQTRTAIKLGFLKSKKAYEESRDVNERLAALVKERFEGFSRGEPGSADYNPQERKNGISDQESQQVLLRAVDENRYGGWTSNDWFDLCEALPNTPENVDLKFEIAGSSLEAMTDDMARSFVFLNVPYLLDTDEESIRERVEAELCAPWEGKKAEAPLTLDAIRYYRANVRQRAGLPLENPERLFQTISHPYLLEDVQNLVLTHALVHNDNKLLDRVLHDHMTSDDWIHPSTIENCLRATKRLALEDEHELILEEAAHLIQRFRIESWATSDIGSCMSALDLAFLAEPDAKSENSPPWFEKAIARIEHERLRLTLLAQEAINRKDWETAFQASSKGVASFPTFYHFYHAKGLAAIELGKIDEAIEALEVYLRYANDDPDYMELEKKVGELKAPQ